MKRLRLCAVLIATLLLGTSATVNAGKIHLTPWDDEGPFVDYPMIAAGFVVGIPAGVVGGALTAPFIALGVAGGSGSVWQETKQRALEIGALSGIMTAVVAGAPFYGMKALLWNAPASAIGRREQRTLQPEPQPSAPSSPGPAPILDEHLNVGAA